MYRLLQYPGGTHFVRAPTKTMGIHYPWAPNKKDLVHPPMTKESPTFSRHPPMRANFLRDPQVLKALTNV